MFSSSSKPKHTFGGTTPELIREDKHILIQMGISNITLIKGRNLQNQTLISVELKTWIEGEALTFFFLSENLELEMGKML